MVSLNPAEAEATGQEYIEAVFGGTTFQVPLDVDSWPLALIRTSRGVKDGRVVANPPTVIAALQVLLGEQWESFLQVAPKRRHLVEASNVFAAAVGIPGDGASDVAFGGIPRLLLILDTWPGKVESDLDRFWHIDYRHRFLFQDERRRLTLRTIHTRMSNLPVDSAVAIAMNGGKLHKTGTELLLMDLFEAQTGRRHPSRPMTAEQIALRDAEKAAEDKARADYRQRQGKPTRQSGIETARANAMEAKKGQNA